VLGILGISPALWTALLEDPEALQDFCTYSLHSLTGALFAGENPNWPEAASGAAHWINLRRGYAGDLKDIRD